MAKHTFTRRQFLAGAGGAAGLTIAAPIIGRSVAFGAPVDPAAATRNRLVVLFLFGGNDALNMVAPTADVAGAARRSVYEKVRPTIAYPAASLLPLDRPGDADHAMGLNPQLPTLHRLYRDDRVAIVQGVDYPDHSYSHFTSSDIWQSGLPGQGFASGWLGRHLDRSGIGDGELRALALGYELPLALKGTMLTGANIASIATTRFVDGTGPIPDSRHQALTRFRDHPTAEPVRRFAGRTVANTVDVVADLSTITAPASTGSVLADQLLTTRVLLEHDLGVETVFVTQPGYDTHTNERQAQEALFADLDSALDAFFHGTRAGVDLGIGPLDPDVASRTTFLVFSEFGRRIGENLSGTDHGAALPVLLIGPPTGAAPNGTSLVPGLHGDHPDMGTALLPADNLAMTTDLRRVYQAVLESWLGDPDPAFESTGALPGLFAGTHAGAASVSASGGGSAEARRAAAGSSTAAAGDGTVTSAGAPAGERGPGLRAAGDLAGVTGLGSPVARSRPTVGRGTAGIAAALAANTVAAALAVRTGALRSAVASVRGADGVADGGDVDETSEVAAGH